MYDNLIKQYINKLDNQMVIELCQKKEININEKEADTLLKYTKKYWEIFYRGDPSDIIKELEQKINSQAFFQLKKLYIEYKNKIN